jgi:hypothetical protein
MSVPDLCGLRGKDGRKHVPDRHLDHVDRQRQRARDSGYDV